MTISYTIGLPYRSEQSTTTFTKMQSSLMKPPWRNSSSRINLGHPDAMFISLQRNNLSLGMHTTLNIRDMHIIFTQTPQKINAVVICKYYDRTIPCWNDSLSMSTCSLVVGSLIGHLGIWHMSTTWLIQQCHGDMLSKWPSEQCIIQTPHHYKEETKMCSLPHPISIQIQMDTRHVVKSWSIINHITIYVASYMLMYTTSLSI